MTITFTSGGARETSDSPAFVATPQMPTGKRILDILIAVPLCVLILPMILVLAVVLAFEHRHSPFFVHQRIGWRGRMVSIPKLRTLSPTTNRYADKTVVPIEGTSRFTKFLRESHLDEIPQLFLVPFGRLSLVGPRPRMAAEAEEHGDARFDDLRTQLPQGCTGLWQISGKRGRVSDHPEYDLFYLAQRTVRLDLWILWRTFMQTAAGRTIDFDQIPSWTLRSPESRSLTGL